MTDCLTQLMSLVLKCLKIKQGLLLRFNRLKTLESATLVKDIFLKLRLFCFCKCSCDREFSSDNSCCCFFAESAFMHCFSLQDWTKEPRPLSLSASDPWGWNHRGARSSSCSTTKQLPQGGTSSILTRSVASIKRSDASPWRMRDVKGRAVGFLCAGGFSHFFKGIKKTVFRDKENKKPSAPKPYVHFFNTAAFFFFFAVAVRVLNNYHNEHSFGQITVQKNPQTFLVKKQTRSLKNWTSTGQSGKIQSSPDDFK